MSRKGQSDIWLLSCVVVLVLVGILMVFSSSFYWSLQRFGNQFHFFSKELIWATIGFGAMAVCAKIPYRRWEKASGPLLVVNLFLLVLVLIIGTEINGAQRWIDIGPVTIMPGELAKFTVVLYMAKRLSREKKSLYNLKVLFPYVIVVGLIVRLILWQPNFSTCVTIFLISFVMLFLAGLPMLYVLFAGAAGAAGGVALIASAEYRRQRFFAFLDPFKDASDKGMQAVQSLLALGSGGIFGVGLGESVQNKLYIPEPQTDFIFSTIGEEFGYLGTTLIILLFTTLIWRGVKIAVRCPDRFGFLFASGIVSIVAIQVLINIAVTTASMPVTGVPLPFISYGGNNLALLMGQMGILLSISKSRKDGVKEK